MLLFLAEVYLQLLVIYWNDLKSAAILLLLKQTLQTI